MDAATQAFGTRAAPQRLSGLQTAALPVRDAGARLDPVSAALLAQAPLRTLLIQCALLAEQHGLGTDADTIRGLVLRLGVDQALFDVARAIVMLHRGDAAEAARMLEREVLLAEPTHELARAVQVCAWRALGRSDWALHANTLLACTRDARVRRLLAHGG
jgi:hypothetical protein